MGLFDFFRRRRERESATAGLAMDPSQQLSSTSDPGAGATSQDRDAVDVAGETYDLAALGQIGALIAQAAREGNIQVHQGTPQEIDLRGTGLREELLGIMQAHGIDAESGSGQQIDASQVPGMQQQILDALSQQGVDVQGIGDSGGSSSGGDSGGGGGSE